MHEQYKKSYKQLSKIMLQFNESISAEAWNKYAKENNYLNSESMKYISRLNWNELKSKINIEKNNF